MIGWRKKKERKKDIDRLEKEKRKKERKKERKILIGWRKKERKKERY